MSETIMRRAFGHRERFSRFYYGPRHLVIAPVIELAPCDSGIGFVPPEFDDLLGEEAETINNLRASHSPSK